MSTSKASEMDSIGSRRQSKLTFYDRALKVKVRVVFTVRNEPISHLFLGLRAFVPRLSAITQDYGTLSVITILQIIESDSFARLRLHLVHNESKNPGHGDGNVFVRLFCFLLLHIALNLTLKSASLVPSRSPPFALGNSLELEERQPIEIFLLRSACFCRIADYFWALLNNKQFIRVDVK